MANDKNDKKDSTSSQLSDTIRKIITAGSPTDISKELIGTVFNQALKAKDDVTLRVTNEMIALVRKIDFVNEFSKFAENHKFKVSAEIEIIKKDMTPAGDTEKK
ncbi:MAG: hypothetical protein A2622_10475 [Bdellovibrionales bacterium RIFCSPHIGHO2_01_FULL_40_29]|nr:MAG: hypothetical protein A2622_10475 [Bdellovibrionales bacterium RIFCSPHIGHO2_01_FULL_40_29]OFZ34385.1 MAG: hypothetical protein A3D17_00740 [Bdellovibrionales bacterium RIFCSPHIGHO2_02_FULL_40_15]